MQTSNIVSTHIIQSNSDFPATQLPFVTNIWLIKFTDCSLRRIIQ
jgi:hypothetical protein